jgi:hypothetical protein
MVFSINHSVEIPGTLLKPGMYVFRLKNQPHGQYGDQTLNAVEVLNGRETRVLAEIYAWQVYDAAPADYTHLTYFQAASAKRKALDAWYHISSNYSEHFVYPVEQAAKIAQITQKLVPSIPTASLSAQSQTAAPPAEALKNEPATAARETAARPVEVLTAKSEPAPAGAATAGAPDSTPEIPDQLPKTASFLPIAVWLGLTALAALVLFKIYRRDPADALNARSMALSRKVAAAAYQSCKLARAASAGK